MIEVFKRYLYYGAKKIYFIMYHLRIYLGVFKHMEKDTVVYFCKLLMKLGVSQKQTHGHEETFPGT